MQEEIFIQCGVRTLRLAPQTLEEIYADIILLGSVLQRRAAARRLVRWMQEELATLARQPAPPHRVYCEEWPSPPTIARGWMSELLALAGQQDVFADRAKERNSAQRRVTDAEIRRRTPDVLILAWRGTGSRANVAEVAARPGWHTLPAVHAGRLLGLDETRLHPGPQLVDGLRALIAALHAV